MALDFPAGPTNGQIFGQWRWDGTKWMPTTGGDITGVAAGTGLSGGGTAGDVTLSLISPVTIANGGTAATSAAAALTSLGAAPLASPVFTGDPRAPTPLAADNDTSIATTAFVKAQSYVTGGPYLPLTGGTLTGGLGMDAATPNFTLSKSASGNTTFVQGRTGTNARWLIYLGDGAAESGSNAGSNFSIWRYSDAGAAIDAPLTITRSTGGITLTGPLATGMAIPAGGHPGNLYVSANLELNQLSWNCFLAASGASWVHQYAAGTAGVFVYDATTNHEFQWYVGPQGAANTPVTLTNVMSLNDGGTLTVRGIVQSVTATGGIAFNERTNANTNWVLFADSGYCQFYNNFAAVSAFLISQDGDVNIPFGRAYRARTNEGGVQHLLGIGTTNNVQINYSPSTQGTGNLYMNAWQNMWLNPNVGNANGNFIVSSGGAFKLGGGVWSDLSDIRVKRSVATYTAGLDELRKLRPVSFEFNGRAGTPDDGRVYVGLIAQEAEEHMPEMAVDPPRDPENIAAYDGLPDLKALDTSALTYALINAVQEIADRLDRLEQPA